MKDSNRVDGMTGEYLGQFCDVALNIRVQFRAEYDRDFILQEFPVEIREGERNTIGSNEQIGIVEVPGIRVEEFELHRPLSQL